MPRILKTSSCKESVSLCMSLVHLFSCLSLCFLDPRCVFLCFALNNILLGKKQAVKPFMKNAKSVASSLSNAFDTVNEDQ